MIVPQNRDILHELAIFLKELKEYQRLMYSDKKLSQAQQRYRDNLRDTLIEKASALKQMIYDVTGKQQVSIPIYGITSDMWDEGLRPFPAPQREDALKLCIDATIGAIGRLKMDINTGIRDRQGQVYCHSEGAERLKNLFSGRYGETLHSAQGDNRMLRVTEKEETCLKNHLKY